MKKILIVLTVLTVGIVMAKGKGEPIPGTDLIYDGSGNVFTDTVDSINNYPYGEYADAEPGTVVVIIGNTGSKSCKIQPADGKKGSQDSIALIIEDGPKKVQIDFSQSKGSGKIPYLYIKGNAEKVLIKGMGEDVGLVVIDNNPSNKGVQLQNISKKGPGFKSIITRGKLKKAQSNHGGFGGESDADPGIIMIGTDSPKAQIQGKDAIANVLICKSVDTNVYSLTEAYAECIATTSIVAEVGLGKIKMLKTKAIGPAVIAVDVSKKIKEKQYGKKIKITELIVGKENFVQ